MFRTLVITTSLSVAFFLQVNSVIAGQKKGTNFKPHSVRRALIHSNKVHRNNHLYRGYYYKNYPYAYYGYPYYYTPTYRVPTRQTVVSPVIVNRTQPVVVNNTSVANPTVDNAAPAANVEVVAQKPVQVPAGSMVRLSGSELTGKGKVVMKWGSRSRSLQVVEWNTDFVVVRIPTLKVRQSFQVDVIVFDGPRDINTTTTLEIVPDTTADDSVEL